MELQRWREPNKQAIWNCPACAQMHRHVNIRPIKGDSVLIDQECSSAHSINGITVSYSSPCLLVSPDVHCAGEKWLFLSNRPKLNISSALEEVSQS